MGDTGVFEEHRDLLYGVAYRMLGSAADADDIVQDAWLRWSAADAADVRNPRAYLVRIVTNAALDRLRSAPARRESYVGPWLPEPLLTSPDIAEHAELAESVSMAVLVVLETLSPVERAVFVLREAFGFPHAEIAEALGRSEASVRQLARRARDHVAERRRRYTIDRAEQRRVTDEFLAAAIGGDLDGLVKLLAPDVVMTTDGGGKRQAIARPVQGAFKVARFMRNVGRRPYDGFAPEDIGAEVADVNGASAIVFRVRGGPVLAVYVLDVGDDGRVSDMHVVVNPDKLEAFAAGRTLPV